MRHLRSEAGQAGAEYLGVLLVVTLVVAALAGAGLGGDLAGGAVRLVRCTATGGGCAAAGAVGDRPAADLPPAPWRNEPMPSPGPQPTPPGPGPAPAPAPATPGPALPGPAPPQPQPPVPWPGAAANLPRSGPRVFVPRKKDRGKPFKVPLGDRGGRKGYIDDDGNKWEWIPEGDPRAHGGAHWDVHHKDGTHTNVYPDGSVRGDDNFPNKSRGDEDGGTNSVTIDPDTGKLIIGGITVGGGIWIAGKLLAPACGPLALVCAAVL